MKCLRANVFISILSNFFLNEKIGLYKITNFLSNKKKFLIISCFISHEFVIYLLLNK